MGASTTGPATKLGMLYGSLGTLVLFQAPFVRLGDVRRIDTNVVI